MAATAQTQKKWLLGRGGGAFSLDISGGKNLE